jgi:hypothetical protein
MLIKVGTPLVNWVLVDSTGVSFEFWYVVGQQSSEIDGTFSSQSLITQGKVEMLHNQVQWTTTKWVVAKVNVAADNN